MLRRVALVRTDISEELSASFIRVTRIGEKLMDAGKKYHREQSWQTGCMSEDAVFKDDDSVFNSKMEAKYSSEISVLTTV
jgi:hypothetical protein